MAFERHITADDFLLELGPKTLLVAAVALPIHFLRKVANGIATTAEEARHTLTSSTILVTTAGWVSFALNALRSSMQCKEYEMKTGQHYQMTWRGKVGMGLFGTAAVVSGIAIQKSGTPGQELVSLACASTSSALAATAGFFADSERVICQRLTQSSHGNASTTEVKKLQ